MGRFLQPRQVERVRVNETIAVVAAGYVQRVPLTKDAVLWKAQGGSENREALELPGFKRLSRANVRRSDIPGIRVLPLLPCIY